MKKARRVLLKVSGEWFSGANEKGFDEKTFESLAKTLIEAINSRLPIILNNNSMKFVNLFLLVFKFNTY